MTHINPIQLRRSENEGNFYCAHITTNGRDRLYVYVEFTRNSKWRYHISNFDTHELIDECGGFKYYRHAKAALETKLAEMMTR
jgi:hypothetical protein